MKGVAVAAAAAGIALVLFGQAPEASVELSMEHRAEAPLSLVSGPEAVSTAAASTMPAPPAAVPLSSPSDEDDRRPTPEELTQVVRQYCVACHNDQMETANLSLQSFDVASAAEMADKAEKMVRKLRPEMMPPPGMPRPDEETLLALVETLEETLDERAAVEPNPGTRAFQRLNRVEYATAVKSLLGLEVDAGAWLPLDSYLAGFDHMADAQPLSPQLLDAYLTAAGVISRLAVGDPEASLARETYSISGRMSQHQWDHVEGAPFGTRGGMVVEHVFPVDGEYVFDLEVRAGNRAEFEDLDLSINGEQVALLPVEPGVSSGNRGGGIPVRTEPVFVPAGQHKVSAAFVRQFAGPYEDLLRPHDWSLAGEGESAGYGVTVLPHLWVMSITGPHNPSEVSDSPTRQRIFTCRPTSAAEERPCAESIISRMGDEAYRRPLTEQDFEGLMSFYDQGAEEGGFENGVRLALQAILASPHFIFRMEREPSDVAPGEIYALNDLDLASRLSFFLWGTPPDSELIGLATENQLSDPDVLEAQARRMLEDPRAEALATRFAAQWLRLQDMENIDPDMYWFPNFSHNLRSDLRRETELFFEHLVQEDRSFLEVLSADYTFVNERLARHYGFSDVIGDDFRRVEYPAGTSRRGVLSHGSVLLLTSMGTRTSPVLRGKWVMEVLLGTPPPPPPPVPALEETAPVTAGEVMTTRQRMEMHRDNPACMSCHQMIDPIGIALDNYDVVGQWRVRERAAPLDTRGELWDGTPVDSPLELSGALLEHPVPIVRTFTSYLMSYAIARPVEDHDQPAIREIARQAEADDYRMSSLILGVVMSDPFRLRRAEAIADNDAELEVRFEDQQHE